MKLEYEAKRFVYFFITPLIGGMILGEAVKRFSEVKDIEWLGIIFGLCISAFLYLNVELPEFAEDKAEVKE